MNSFLGIRSDKSDKKERLTVDEEEDRNETINNITLNEINCRKKCFELIKKCFSIEVKIYEN